MKTGPNPCGKKGLFLFIFFLSIYLATGSAKLNSYSNDDYSLGADVGSYLKIYSLPYRDADITLRHPLTVSFSFMIHPVLSLLRGIINKNLIIKLFFACFGALNVLIAYSIFSIFNKKDSFVLSLIYGFSASIWFFSSFPESFIITVFFSLLYLLLFMKFHSHWTPGKFVLFTFILILGALNEVSLIALLIIPLLYHIKQLISDRKLIIFAALYILLITSIVYIILTAVYIRLVSSSYNLSSVYRYYHWFARFFLDKHPHSLSAAKEGILNFIFFNIGFPSHRASSLSVPYPWYKGVFYPSLLTYLKDIFSAAFLILYAPLLIFAAYWALLKREKIILILLSAVILRISVFCFVNPWETFLYSPVINLPLLVILFSPFSSSSFRYKTAFLHVFLITLFINNLGFFI